MPAGAADGDVRVSYNDLCFPKTSNYGSMKKKKLHSVGVDCRLARVAAPGAPGARPASLAQVVAPPRPASIYSS